MDNLSINCTDGNIITENQLKFFPIEQEYVPLVKLNVSLKEAAENTEKELIRLALIKYKGNKSKVIKELDTTFPTLVKKMKKYGLEN